MTWTDNRKRIRRFLRDPNANIWSNSLLLDLWNRAQVEINDQTNFLEKVEAVRVPPGYDASYLYDWEWSYLPSGHGYCHQAFHYYEQGDAVICYPWEGQAIAGIDGADSDIGPHFTHPWEGFMTPCADPVPLMMPYGFSQAVLVSWDKWPIDGITKKEITSDDASWKLRSGRSFQWWRFDALDNIFFLYPLPSTPNWNDGDASEVGMITGITDITFDSELGTITNIPGYLFNQDLGIVTEVIEAEDNVLFVFKAEPTKIEGDTDGNDFPDLLLKYIEYATLELAFNADTDGKQDDLREFWGQRKTIGIEIIKRFISKRRQDRDYRLVTRGGSGNRFRRQPRLPDTYPAV